MSDELNIKPSIKLSIVNPDAEGRSVLGRGVVQLLEAVDKFGSLNQAAQSMKMAYSKAWRITKGTEAALGFKLVESVRPNGTVLTPEGKKLIRVYNELRADLQKQAEKKFQKLMEKD